jgi:hypothetical protein
MHTFLREVFTSFIAFRPDPVKLCQDAEKEGCDAQ